VCRAAIETVTHGSAGLDAAPGPDLGSSGLAAAGLMAALQQNLQGDDSDDPTSDSSAEDDEGRRLLIFSFSYSFQILVIGLPARFWFLEILKRSRFGTA